MTHPSFLQFRRFAIVGMLGFVVDGGLLYLLLQLQFDFYLARGITFPLALSVTWYLNRRWTFAISADQGKIRDYKRYALIQFAGAAANYGIYALILVFVKHTPGNALFALAIGALAGLILNFAGSRWWAFADSLKSSRASAYE